MPAFAVYCTAKLLPSLEAAPGTAPAVELGAPGEAIRAGEVAAAVPSGTSEIAVLVQPGFAVSVPPTLFPIAAIFVNETEPKFESGIWLQR